MNLKRLVVLSLASIATILSASAQGFKVSSAIGYIEDYGKWKEVKNLDEAQKFITEASTHEKTGVQAKTWYYKGFINQLLYQDSSRTLAEKPSNLLTETLEAYMKASEIHNAGDKKLDLDNALAKQLPTNMKIVCAQLYNQGIGQFEIKDYEGALKSFVSAAKAYETGAVDSKLDTATYYNIAITASNLDKVEESAKWYDKVIAMKYKAGEMYYLKARLYKDSDPAKHEAIIKEGRTVYPEDPALITEELNIYLKAGKDEEAMENLKSAVKADPQNKVLHYNLGTVFFNLCGFSADDEIENPKDEKYLNLIAESEKAFNDAIALDPAYFDAYSNLGALYINHAKAQDKFANAIDDQKKYEVESKIANSYFEKALVPLEKAHELDATDQSTMNTLKQLYAALGKMDKVAEMKAKMGQ